MASAIQAAKVKCSTCSNMIDHYSCPQCSEKIKKRPSLLKSRKFHNIVKNFRTAEPDREEKGCTFCIRSHAPAVKCCQHCAAYLCNDHLKAHSKSPEHVLCDPNVSLEKRRCRDHKEEQLKFYCIDDADCICVTCRLDGEHRGHQVESLEVASEMMKEKLRNVRQKLMTEKVETEKRVQSLQERRVKVQRKVADEKERVTVLIRDLSRRLEDLEKRVLSDISGQAERVFLSLDDRIQQLEIKNDMLSRKMGDIEELCNMTDPLTVLQESDTGDLYDTEDGDDEDRDDGGDLDVTGILHTLNTGLSGIMSGVNVQKRPGTHVYPYPSAKDKVHITVELFRPNTQPNPTVQRLHQAGGPNIGAVQQQSGVSGFTDILLDVSTAGNHLRISDDGKTASWSDINQNRPETPNRFIDYPQVLSSWTFSSGRHYWEVDVGGSDDFGVGMCYPSIERRGGQSVFGNNKKSWGLERWDNRYSVRQNRKEIPLPGLISSNRVRIGLDYEAGRISFYDVCDQIRHLHTFTTTFTKPLHVGLNVREGSIEILGRSQMLEI